MSAPTYAIGVHFGTESARALLLNARTGEELAVAVTPYPHGVLDATLPDTGEQLPPDWALQDPDDWTLALQSSAAAAPFGLRRRARSRRRAGDRLHLLHRAAGCARRHPTVHHPPLAVAPSRVAEALEHHAAQPVADRLTDVARERGEEFIDRYGGRISSEGLPGAFAPAM